MESNKQEKYDLMHDNPVAKDASGGRDGSWMSKHSKSQMGSPLHEKVTMTKKKTKIDPKPATPPYGTVTGSGDTNELGKPKY